MSTIDSWKELTAFTDARVALGRSGGSLTTSEMLQFRKDHALAKDAVWAGLNCNELARRLEKSLRVKSLQLQSQAIDRQMYIQRPDLGRRLDHSSIGLLKRTRKKNTDISISIADGLSALAIDRHAVPFLNVLLPLLAPFQLAPMVILRQGRVAISDQVGYLLGSKLSIILIGERPGLSSPDSLGVYMTYDPKPGNTDEKRNCISNIRAEGLSNEFAAQKLSFLVSEAFRRKLSGVDLKDTHDATFINPLNTPKLLERE